MSEKSREEEKLSFKEQILRDLEKVKGYDEVLKEDEAVVRTPANEPSAEELMADSLSTVEEIMRKAPTVPTHQVKVYQLLQQMRFKEKLLVFQVIQVKMYLLLQRKKVDQDQVQVLLDLRNLKENTMKPQQG